MLEELKKNLLDSKWDQEYKQKLVSLLPMLGKNYVQFLYNESGKIGFEFSQQSLTEAVTACVDAQRQLNSGSSIKAEQILNTSPGYGWWNNGLYILPWLLDLEQFIKINKFNVDKKLEQSILFFKIKMFDFLTVNQVEELLSMHAVKVVDKGVDLLSLMKRYVYLKGWQGDNKIVRPFVDALTSNYEIMFPGTISVDGKNVSASFGNIFQDFISSSSSLANQKGAYDISKYVISSKTASHLSKANKETLLNLLSLYLWLLNPVVSRAELGFYDVVDSVGNSSYGDNVDDGFKEDLQLTPQPSVSQPLGPVVADLQKALSPAPVSDIREKPIVPRPGVPVRVLPVQGLQNPGLRLDRQAGIKNGQGLNSGDNKTVTAPPFTKRSNDPFVSQNLNLYSAGDLAAMESKNDSASRKIDKKLEELKEKIEN